MRQHFNENAFNDAAFNDSVGAFVPFIVDTIDPGVSFTVSDELDIAFIISDELGGANE